MMDALEHTQKVSDRGESDLPSGWRYVENIYTHAELEILVMATTSQIHSIVWYRMHSHQCNKCSYISPKGNHTSKTKDSKSRQRGRDLLDAALGELRRVQARTRAEATWRERERRKEKSQEVNDIFTRSPFRMWLLVNLTFLFNVKGVPLFATSIDTHRLSDRRKHTCCL
jgi:hypothetical protein